ncbi:MAG: hypothetical protein WBF83_05370 [Moheibacter sp.]
MKRFIFLLISQTFFFGCKSEPRAHPIQFYHWKSNADIGQTEVEYFNKLNSNRLYIRLFDVVQKDGRPEPTAMLQNFDSKKLNAAYIPTVYLINEVFYKLSASENQKLAENVFELIQKISKNYGIENFDQIQIDCDWTESTRDSYFQFLKELKEISQKIIGSTLRLHQVKFSNKTGIPPADKVYLMCYATSSPIEEIEKNSILDLDLVKDYLKDIDRYPLKTDVALPIYSWAIVTNHLGKKKLINGVSKSDLDNENYKKLKDGYYRIESDTFLRGIYLNKGFEIKLETIPAELLKQTRNFLDSKIKSDFEIVYYHLDQMFLKRYTIDDLK